MRLTLTKEEHYILTSALPLIGAKSVAQAVREAVDSQVDVARSLLIELERNQQIQSRPQID